MWEEVDPGIVGVDHAGCLEGQLGEIGRKIHGLHGCPLRDVGLPALSAADHRRDDAVAHHEGAEVPTAVGHVGLQVVHGAGELQRAKGAVGDVPVRDADHAPPLGAEQGLEHDVPPQFLDRGHGVLEPLAGDGPGCRHAGLLEQERGVVLVHAPLDAARGVDDGDAEAGEAVEGVDPEDDLLQGAGGNGADHDGAALIEGAPLVREREGPAADAPGQPGDRQHHRLHAPLVQGLQEARLVPAPARAEDRDLHARPSEACNTSTLTRPRRMTRPVRRLLIVTSAGLNSILSIL